MFMQEMLSGSTYLLYRRYNDPAAIVKILYVAR